MQDFALDSSKKFAYILQESLVHSILASTANWPSRQGDISEGDGDLGDKMSESEDDWSTVMLYVCIVVCRGGGGGGAFPTSIVSVACSKPLSPTLGAYAKTLPEACGAVAAAVTIGSG